MPEIVQTVTLVKISYYSLFNTKHLVISILGTESLSSSESLEIIGLCSSSSLGFGRKGWLTDSAKTACYALIVLSDCVCRNMAWKCSGVRTKGTKTNLIISVCMFYHL